MAVMCNYNHVDRRPILWTSYSPSIAPSTTRMIPNVTFGWESTYLWISTDIGEVYGSPLSAELDAQLSCNLPVVLAAPLAFHRRDRLSIILLPAHEAILCCSSSRARPRTVYSGPVHPNFQATSPSLVFPRRAIDQPLSRSLPCLSTRRLALQCSLGYMVADLGLVYLAGRRTWTPKSCRFFTVEFAR